MGDNKKILVVEDDPFIALDLTMELETRGFDVISTAESVSEATEVIACSNVDFAILDFNLGHETSRPVAEKLRERKIPFVILTGNPSGAKAVTHGSIPILTKPVDMESVVANITR